MLSTIVISGLVFAGLSVAQSTISLYIPGADTQSLVGSIIASDATATTYAIECAPNTDGSDCGFNGAITLTEGPSTAVYTLSEAGGASGSSGGVAFTGYYDCSLGASSAVCAESFGGDEANFPGSSTETFTGTDFTYMPVVITAGVLNTGGAAAPSSTTAAPTPSNTSGGKKTSSGASNTSSGAAQTQGTSGSSTSTSTGGVPMITGNAKWVLGGAALAAALI